MVRIAIVVDTLTGWTAIAVAQMHLTTIHIRWPMSLIIYPGGAAISNIIFYLVPIPLVLWLVSSLAFRGQWQTPTFWVVGAIAAAIEPVLQDLGSPGHPWMMVATFAEDYALNIAPVYAFQWAEIGASVVLRTAIHVVWHVFWGAIHP